MPRSTISMPRISTGIDLDKCVNFNGSSSKVTFTVPTSFNPANLASFTIAVWLNPNSISTSTAHRIIELDNGTPGAGFRILLGNTATTKGVRVIIAHTVTGAEKSTGVSSLKIGVWQRVLFTWSDSDNTPTVYINGTSYNVASVNKNGSRVDVSGMTAGVGSTSAGASYYSGLMDEFCVWNRVLTAQEIQDDYSQGSTPVSTSGLILRYAMNEASGDLTDASGNSITGTPTSLTQDITSYSTGPRTVAGGRIAIASGAISATNLTTSGTSTNNSTSIITPSISPSANALVVVTVWNKLDAGATLPTVTGASGTWVQVGTVTSVDGIRRCTMFRDLSASPGSGALTVSFGATTQDNAACSVDQFTNVVKSGTNGSGAIVQVKSTVQVGTFTGVTVTLNTLTNTNNVAYGGVREGGGGAITAGLTELSEPGPAGNLYNTQWGTNQTSVSWTWASVSASTVALAIEIASGLRMAA